MVYSLRLCNLAKLIATKKRLKANRLDYEFLKSSNFINIIHSKKCKILEINDTPRISIFSNNNSNNANDDKDEDKKNRNHLHVLTIVLFTVNITIHR